MGWGEEYNSRYETIFNSEPDAYHLYIEDQYREGIQVHSDQSKPAIQILEYESNDSKYRSFATFGLSHFPDFVGQVCEIFTDLHTKDRASFEDVRNIIAFCAWRSVLLAHKIQPGVSIHFGDTFAQFLAATHKSALYISQAISLSVGYDLVKYNGQEGLIYLGIFITEDEFHYLQALGKEALEKKFYEADIDYNDVHRTSCLVEI